MSPEQIVGGLSETIIDRYGEKKFDVEDIGRSLEEAGPYQNVFMQVGFSTIKYMGEDRGKRTRNPDATNAQMNSVDASLFVCSISHSIDALLIYLLHPLQEMDVMNTLLSEIIRSLKELQLGFAGELTMSDAMESLMDDLYLDKVNSQVAWTFYYVINAGNKI